MSVDYNGNLYPSFSGAFGQLLDVLEGKSEPWYSFETVANPAGLLGVESVLVTAVSYDEAGDPADSFTFRIGREFKKTALSDDKPEIGQAEEPIEWKIFNARLDGFRDGAKWHAGLLH